MMILILSIVVGIHDSLNPHVWQLYNLIMDENVIVFSKGYLTKTFDHRWAEILTSWLLLDFSVPKGVGNITTRVSVIADLSSNNGAVLLELQAAPHYFTPLSN